MSDSPRDIVVSMPEYRVTIPADRPYAYLDTRAGRVAELFLLSTADVAHGGDATSEMGEWSVLESGEGTTLTAWASSSVWDRRWYRLVCRPDGIEYRTTVEGSGALTDVTYFGGYSAAHPRWGAGRFHSGHAFSRGFNPEPDAAGSLWFDPRSESTIDLGGGPLPGRRHWFFTPAPFCYAFESHGLWLAMGLSAGQGTYRFTEFRYRGGDGFCFTVPYDGRTRVEGQYELPTVWIGMSNDPLEALKAHVAQAGGAVSRSVAATPSWWREPIFCGWGAQCAQAASGQGYRPEGAPDAAAFVRTLASASGQATQTAYEEWIATLAARGVRPGTVVIDDKWQRTYGDNDVDPEKWPDLAGFVRQRHADGQHVLLWLKAWDPEGIPVEECIRTTASLALAVDPTNPAYEERLRRSVRRMLSAGGYGADGFKIDFTHRIPVGPGLQLHGDAWGLELMRRYLEIVHEESHRVKEDALIVAHAPHPYLADVVDMIRLNDMLDLTLLTPENREAAGVGLLASLERRAAVARIARPDAPIDTDNWPVPDRETWREYIRRQPEYGVPALYFATTIDITQEPLQEEDYRLIRETWERYRVLSLES